MQGNTDVLEDEINHLTALKRQVDILGALWAWGVQAKGGVPQEKPVSHMKLSPGPATPSAGDDTTYFLLMFTSLVIWSHHTF